MLLLRPSSSPLLTRVLRTSSKSSRTTLIKPFFTTHTPLRPFTTTPIASMPEPLTSSEVNSKTDPSVAKQWDTETPMHQQFEELYGIVDKLKISLLTTQRPGVGPVSRSMAVAKRVGPDFLYLANKHSAKFEDLDGNKEVMIAFQDSSTQNWVSITGTATTVDNSDPRIKDLHSKFVSAWFGDLGDGVHTGGPEDPRMTLIEVKSKYVHTLFVISTMDAYFLSQIHQLLEEYLDESRLPQGDHS